MTMNTGIYKISAPSGHFYIGSAVQIDRRWRRHLKDLRSNKHANIGLQRATKKYGIDSLEFSKMIICAPCDLLLFEQRAIDVMRPEYNIAPVAGSSLGIKRSDEFKTKVSNGMKGRKVSAETRARIGEKHKGKTLKPYQLQALADGRARKPLSVEFRREQAKAMHTPASREKRRLAQIGRQVSAETRAKISSSLRRTKSDKVAATLQNNE